MAKNTKVTVVQNPMGMPSAIKVGDVEIPVTMASPAFTAGGMSLTVTLTNIDLAVEQQPGLQPGPTPTA